MRHAPFRPGLEAIAHTLVYDANVVGDRKPPTLRLRSIKSPTLVVYGGDSPAFMGEAAQALAATLPDGRQRALDGQSHDIVPSALAPVLLEFFARQ
jgi:pimeloyl-ACP methyl ester carboxylesterase